MKLSKEKLEEYLRSVIKRCYEDYNTYPFLHSQSLQALTQETLDKYLNTDLNIEEINSRIAYDFEVREKSFNARKENVNNIVQRLEEKQQEIKQEENKEEVKKEDFE